MSRVRCPICDREQIVESSWCDDDIECCFCGGVFNTEPSAPGESARNYYLTNRGALTTRLTSPHYCQHPRCRFPIEVPIGRREATLTCPDCNCRTSVFAVVYRCPGCQAILESPATIATRNVMPVFLSSEVTATTPPERHERCPACGRDVAVPFDLLEPWRVDKKLDSDAYRLRCPNCAGELMTLRKHAGLRAVCPACLYIVTVPRFGPHRSEPALAHTALAALSDSADEPCPECGTRIPKRARSCPFCQATI
jgi:hypothetical protein